MHNKVYNSMLLFGNDNFFFKFFQGLINFEEENL